MDDEVVRLEFEKPWSDGEGRGEAAWGGGWVGRSESRRGTSSKGGAGTGGAGAGGASTGGAGAGAGGASTGGTGTGGSTGTGGATGPVGPCDIYKTAGTPCAAAHATVRALYAAYTGPLYQIQRASDKAVKDVPVGDGGFADTTVQDSFCAGTTCTIPIIYDQSGNNNHMRVTWWAYWLRNGGKPADANGQKIKVGGHTVYGIKVTSGSNIGYRTGVQLEGKASITKGSIGYGNSEMSGWDEGNGTMECVYFGTDVTWGGKGEGSGPWVAADLENGMYKCDKGGWGSDSLQVPSAKSINADYATAMVKGPAANHFTLKAGNAQSGTLVTMWDGARPSGSGYNPKALRGAVILGTGGDGSPGGTGTWFEGVVTKGTPPDEVDNSIQANIVAVGYGR